MTKAATTGGSVRYLLLDGISAKVIEVGVKGKVFPGAYGIRGDGRGRSWALSSPTRSPVTSFPVKGIGETMLPDWL